MKLLVEKLTLGRNETLMVTHHHKSGKWIASVGSLNSDEQRELVWAASPVNALAELLLLIGGNVEGKP